MKIIAAADIHGAQFRLNLLLDKIKKFNPDLVALCGDITQFGPDSQAKSLLGQIKKETFAVTGNIDTEDVKKGITDSIATFLEFKKIERENHSFIGVNGSREEDFKKIEDLIDEKTIILSHVPPYKIQDEIYKGKNGGSKILKQLVEDKKPLMVLCGHIHENPGFRKYKDTWVVNCSMGKNGEGALIEINKDISIEMLG
ncbi:MAG: metallophosphoesterase [Candidatus Thermoplasmatota archaeon]